MFDNTRPHLHIRWLYNGDSCISAKHMAKVFWNAKQISSELKQYYNVEGLDDVRIIRDRQTSEFARSGRAYQDADNGAKNNRDSLASSAFRLCRMQKYSWTGTTPPSTCTVMTTSLTKTP
jgi:hypothetical protein